MVYLLLFIFLFVSLTHAAPVDDEKIVGGQTAVAAAYSWEVSLGEIKDAPKTQQARQAQAASIKLEAHFCGGVLLNERWVLTAAHCVVKDLTKDDPIAANEIGVGFGRDLVDIYNKGRIPAAAVYIKKGYNSELATSKEDIAVVQLSQPVTIKPACLGGTTTPNYGARLTSVGWGNINPLVLDQETGRWSGVQAPQYMKQTMMKDVSSSARYCKSRSDLICIDAVNPKQGPCKGDSGGSLVWNNKVVGVTSFGGAIQVAKFKQQVCNGDAAYTRLSKNIDWIKQVTKSNVCVQ